MSGAGAGERVKRKLLVFNDVFQPLTDSTQQHRALKRSGSRRGQRPVVFCVSGWGCGLFMGSLRVWRGAGEDDPRGELCGWRVGAKTQQLFSVSLYKIPSLSHRSPSPPPLRIFLLSLFRTQYFPQIWGIIPVFSALDR